MFLRQILASISEEQNNIIQELLNEQIIEDVHHEPEEINHIFYFE